MNRFKLQRRHHAPDTDGAGGAGGQSGQSCQSGQAGQGAQGTPGGADPPSTAAVLDAEALDRLRQLDPDGSRGFLGQLLRTFESSLVRHLAHLREAQAQSDLKRAGDVAHTLKSSSGSVGALVFAQGCALVERGARQGDAAVLGAPLDGLLLEGERVVTAVRAMLAA